MPDMHCRDRWYECEGGIKAHNTLLCSVLCHFYIHTSLINVNTNILLVINKQSNEPNETAGWTVCITVNVGIFMM